ncbi:MAG: hypothetical protein FWJ72_16600, partial [Acidimicrobiia bacterium]
MASRPAARRAPAAGQRLLELVELLRHLLERPPQHVGEPVEAQHGADGDDAPLLEDHADADGGGGPHGEDAGGRRVGAVAPQRRPPGGPPRAGAGGEQAGDGVAAGAVGPQGL